MPQTIIDNESDHITMIGLYTDKSKQISNSDEDSYMTTVSLLMSVTTYQKCSGFGLFIGKGLTECVGGSFEFIPKNNGIYRWKLATMKDDVPGIIIIFDRIFWRWRGLMCKIDYNLYLRPYVAFDSCDTRYRNFDLYPQGNYRFQAIAENEFTRFDELLDPRYKMFCLTKMDC